jgi:hypothetical protein
MYSWFNVLPCFDRLVKGPSAFHDIIESRRTKCIIRWGNSFCRNFIRLERPTRENELCFWNNDSWMVTFLLSCSSLIKTSSTARSNTANYSFETLQLYFYHTLGFFFVFTIATVVAHSSVEATFSVPLKFLLKKFIHFFTPKTGNLLLKVVLFTIS